MGGRTDAYKEVYELLQYYTNKMILDIVSYYYLHLTLFPYTIYIIYSIETHHIVKKVSELFLWELNVISFNPQ